MISIFKNPDHHDIFRQDGYIVLPLLDSIHVNELKDNYTAMGLKDRNAYDISKERMRYTPNMVRQIRDGIWKVVLPRLDEHFSGYKPVFAEYLAKDPNPASIIPAHQDWAFVDSEIEGFDSISLWIALEDVFMENGAMGVVRGSQNIREITTPPSPSPMAPLPLNSHIFTVFSYMNFITMKAGEVLVFNNRTFHGSLPNISTKSRLVARMSITQKQANLSHFYLKPDGTCNTMIQYAVDDEFPIKYTNELLADMYNQGQIIEDYPIIGERIYQFPQYTPDTLVNMMKGLGNQYNAEVCAMLEPHFGEDMKKEGIIIEKKGNLGTVSPITQEKKMNSMVQHIYNKIRNGLKGN